VPEQKASFTKARSLEKLEADALFALREMNRAETTVRIHFATMREMREMKLKYLGKDQEVVDVLAFPEDDSFPHPDDPSRIGEIFLNWDAFAEDYAHLRFLLVHSILHLLGYQHEGTRDTIEMESLEETLCRRIASQD
jgi:rRNA maturation RNase YbeY